MDKHSRVVKISTGSLKKLSAIMLLAVFTISSVTINAFSGISALYPDYPALSEDTVPGQAILDPETFFLPSHLGDVVDKHTGTSGKTVVHIQDAHSNYAAQLKISSIIDYVNQEYGIKVLNLEGGSGEYDLTVFSSISGEEIRREVADHFLQKGEVNGAEFYAIRNSGRIWLWGVEDRDLYLKNLEVYRQSLSYSKEVQQYLLELEHIFENLARHILPQDLVRMHVAYKRYKAEEMEFREYLDLIIKKARRRGISVKDFPNIYFIAQALEKEEEVDFRRANSQRRELIERLKEILSPSETRKLISRTVEFRNRQISMKEFYNYLLQKSRQCNIDPQEYPALSSYIVYISLFNAVDRFRVMDELDALEREIKETFFRNDIEREIDALSRNLTLMKNIFGITLTRTDFEYFKANKKSFKTQNFLRFIERKALRYNIRSRPSDTISRLDKYLEEIALFYEYSFDRDQAFIENMVFEKTQTGEKAAVIMTGGFHTENLCRLFKEKGYSYVSIMPRFTLEKDYENPYFELLAGQTTDVRHILQSALTQTGLIQVASMLNTIGESLGTEVWGQAGIDAFRATVRLRELLARGNYEKVIIDMGEASDIVIRLGAQRNMEVTREVDEEVDERSVRMDLKELSDHLDRLRQKIRRRSMELAEEDRLADIRTEDPEMARSLNNFGQFTVQGEPVYEGFKSREEGNFLRVSHEDSGTEVRVRILQKDLPADRIINDLQSMVKGAEGISNTLTDTEKESIISVLNAFSENIKSLSVISPNEKVSAHLSSDNTFYVNDNLLRQPGKLLDILLRELHPGYEDIDRVVLYEGLPLDARLATRSLWAEYGNIRTGSEEWLGKFINDLKNLLKETSGRELELGEESLIRRNFETIRERPQGRRISQEVGSEFLLYGLRDHMDPSGNLTLAGEIVGMQEEVRRNSRNIVFDENSNFLSENAAQQMGQKMSRVYRRTWGVDTSYSTFADNTEAGLRERVLKPALVQVESSRDRYPLVLIKCSKELTLNTLKDLLEEPEYRELKDLVVFVNSPSEEPEKHFENVPRLLHLANQALNYRRMQLYFGHEVTDPVMMQLARGMIEHLERARYLDAYSLSTYLREFDINFTGIANLSSEELNKVLEGMFSGELEIAITKVDWSELSNYMNAMEAVYTSL